VYLVPANVAPLPLPNVDAATDSEMMITPALPSVFEPNGYSSTGYISYCI